MYTCARVDHSTATSTVYTVTESASVNCVSKSMAESDYMETAATTTTHHHQKETKSAILESLNTIIQHHFEKTLEKKRSIDLQKKQLWKFYQLFFIFLSLILYTLTQSPTKLRCRHAWIPILFLSFSHLIFYLSVAQTLRCVNGFKYQRRCHKLTLGLATEKLRQLNMRQSSRAEDADEVEIRYQEPPESYFGKFKRNWALHFVFLLLVYAFMISSSVVLLCY